MILQEAKKVIGLNIHKLNGSMQQAVALLMDKEEGEDKLTDFEEEVQIEMLLYAGRKQRREIVDENEYVRCAASRLLAHAREELKRLVMKDAVEGKVVELGETYKDLSISVGGKELNEVLQPLGVKDGDKVKVIIVKEAEK